MNPVKKFVQSVKNAVSIDEPYNMDTKEARESQAIEDYETAKLHRQTQDQKWIEMDNLYHNKHKSSVIAKLMEAKGEVPYELPALTDAFIQVESQIDTIVPDFQFKGRDGDLDSTKAKCRTDVVNFICYNNKLDRLNIENERNLNKLGNAFWKVSWNADIVGPGYVGDIEIGNPSPTYIFPDPAAYEIDQCEYIDYSYRMHRRAAKRKWGDIIDTVGSSATHYDTEIFDRKTGTFIDDSTVQVIEHWFRDEMGDIACTILVERTEVQFIPKFWEKTAKSGNKSYPFVKYCKIPLEQSFWDLSEIEIIKDLLNAGDMEFMTSLLNDHFMANDIIIYEEGALAEGYEIKHIPGEEIPLNPNKIDKIRRLGGVSNNANLLNMMAFIKEKIEETTGNAASQQGIEPARVTTFRGIAALNERAEKRRHVKKYDRLKGFEELYKLLDWMALEFYDDNRTVIIRGKTKEEKDQAFMINSDEYQVVGNSGLKYFPTIDVEVTAGDGIEKSKSFTMQMIGDLIKTPITVLNIGLVESYIDIMELPDAEELKNNIRKGLADFMQQQQQMMGGGGQLGGQPGGLVQPGGVMPPMANTPSNGNNPQNAQNAQPSESEQISQLIHSMSPAEFAIYKGKSKDQKMELLQKLLDGNVGQPTNPQG